MLALPEALPIIVVIAILVGALLSVHKHGPAQRVRLWAYAWALTFLHFTARGIETHSGTLERVIEGVDVGALELAAIVFLASLAFKEEDSRGRKAFLGALGLPLVAHAFANSFAWRTSGASAGLVVLIFLIAAAYAARALSPRVHMQIAAAGAMVCAGVWAIREQLVHRNPWFAIVVILAIAYGLAGVLFWRAYRRRSLGVLAAAGGFLGWGAVYPAGILLQRLAPGLEVRLDFWNLPRLFVALGMVVTLLEDKTILIEQASERARAENVLLQKLSQVASRAAASSDPAPLCAEVAAAIASASSFRSAALLFAGEDRKLRLAGSQGFTAEETAELQRRAGDDAATSLSQMCANAARVGNSSVLLCEESRLVLIPLLSLRGSPMGCLCVAGLKEGREPDPSEIMKLEVFASDLAATVENMRLHQQLVQSEKLNALGQLVAGAAHELNNPLTGIIGYADLLAEEAEEPLTARRAEKLGSEARRMKRIVEGLLRFARNSPSGARAACLETVLRDVVQLREYQARKLGIRIDAQIASPLPPLGIGEDELKQVLLNILNNAMDAIEECPRREIRIRASSDAGRVAVSFEDSGPGFTDPGRAFDPFYTTKPVGKGTGLGLSICYGVLQDCGGKISVANNVPGGASVLLDLPAALPVDTPVSASPALAVKV